MRKFVFMLVLVLGILVCAGASAQSFTFRDIYAKCDVPDTLIILTPDNLAEHTEWVAGSGRTAEEILADFAARGVLVQAWSADKDVCFEITAVQDDAAQQYFDLDQQETKARSAYRKEHLSGSAFKAQGYTYQSAEWEKDAQYGRFLALKYKQTVNGVLHRGYAKRTIRNGYTITLDYQVWNRSMKSADKKAIEQIMATFTFTSVKDKPADAVAKTVITAQPPTETNTGSFTVEGTCEPGLTVTGVIMRMSSPDPINVEDTASKTGKFALDVQLPEEGVWLMTLTVANGDVVTEELVFDTTTYQKSLLPVNLDEEIPTELTGDSLVISGKTVKNVKVQCIVGDSYDKQITTNGTGKFSFKINTSKQGTYDIVLVFQKKNYEIRRFTYTAGRELTEEDQQAQYRADAIKPAYSTLTSKLTGYTGRVMGYNLYVVSISQSGDDWVIFMAMNQAKSGAYRDIVVVTTKQEPNFSVDSQQRMYGTCVGQYQTEDSEGKSQVYPCFELLFWD